MPDSGGLSPAMIAEAKADLAKPPSLAEGLRGLFYGPEFFSLECATLFRHTWCAIAVGAAVPNPGDMLPIDLAGNPLLVLRDRNGEIRVFYNICRHRAMRLVGAPCSQATRIQCPWHAWTYDLRGKLLGTPELGGPGVNTVDGLDRSTLGLKEVAVGRWLDYVFVNLDASAPPFDEHIQPLKELLADFKLDQLRHATRLDDVYHGNWKLATEGGIEDYHLPFGHPQLNAHLYRNSKPLVAHGVFAGGAVAVDAAPAVADSGGTPDRPWNARLPSLTLRNGEPLPELLVFNVFPTGTVLIAADHVMLGMLLPDGPSRTRVELHLYFDGGAAHEADYAQARAETLAMWREVVPQDFAFIEGPQATLAARDAAGIRTRFSPYWERAVLEFQRMVLDAVDPPSRQPEDRNTTKGGATG